MRSPFRALLPAITLLPLAACATPGATSFATAEADPWEGRNRRIYAFNAKVDRVALKPIANTYRTVVPKAGRTAISNLYSTYGEPANFLNSLLQGKIKQAFRTVDRFLLNATIGVGGVADNATDLGRPQESEDFGQTFAKWGFEAGPYLVLPIFGPTTLRDGVGLGFDIVIDPADFARNAAFSPSLWWRGGQIAGRIVTFRARVSDQGGDALLADSLDEYALVKSIYLQNRRNALFDGNPPLDDDLPVEDDLGAPAPAPPPVATPPAATPPR